MEVINNRVEHNRTMPSTIPVAHDFICPWCWVGFFQARRLEAEFGVQIDWVGYELFPEGLYWPDYPTPAPAPHNRPATPTRFDLMKAAEGIVIPDVERPHKMRTYNAHQALEYAKTEGRDVANRFNEALYRAYWERGDNINEVSVLTRLAGGIVHDIHAMLDAVKHKRFRDKVVKFDDDAYAKGVYNVPTFFIGGERYAEQPYSELSRAVAAYISEVRESSIYANLEFPAAPKNRPYVFCNMVSTIDGKILSGERDESVADLGSDLDHLLMKRTERAADGVIIGAGTLRATPSRWNPQSAKRFVVSRGGKLPQDHQFLLGGESYIATSGSAMFTPPAGVRVLRAGNTELDLPMLLHRIHDLGVRNLLCLGGSDLNAQLLRHNLVDELFLTVAPKIKLGDHVPTYAGGKPLDRRDIQNFDLIEHHVVDSEVFLRYRRRH